MNSLHLLLHPAILGFTLKNLRTAIKSHPLGPTEISSLNSFSKQFVKYGFQDPYYRKKWDN